jgi:hypothetical protein
MERIEWWHGRMRPATDAEILAVFNPTPPQDAATTRGEGCSECGGVIAHVGGTLCEAHTIITGPWESTTRGEG